MKLLLSFLLFVNTAQASKIDPDNLWRSACEMILREDNPYKSLPLDGLIAVGEGLKDQAAWIEMLIRLRDPHVSAIDKRRVRIALEKIF